MRMRRTALSLLVTLGLATVSLAEEPSRGSAESVVKSWVAILNKNDPEKFLAVYDRSEETEVVLSTGVRLRSFQAIQNAYNNDFQEVRFYDSSAKQINTRLLGKTAIVSFEHLFKIHVTADGSRWQIHIRTTSVLHRLTDQWKVVLEHSSPIRGIERMTRIED